MLECSVMSLVLQGVSTVLSLGRFVTYILDVRVNYTYAFSIGLADATLLFHSDDWGRPDGRAPRGSFLTISAHLSIEGQGPRHHVEAARRWCSNTSPPQCGGATVGSPWSSSTSPSLGRCGVAPLPSCFIDTQ